MTSKAGQNMLRVIRAAAHRVRDEGVSDADLLAQYAAERDELAFATLVRRHARMVLGVAERVLGQEQDAEDVCQATFLLLAQKACRGLRRQSIAGWLCATARLTALNARKTKRRRTRTETQAGARTVKQLLPTPLERMSA
ncbi:MAG TPA: sigma factor, partial [Gemmataceae bacterium]|nr:sigma factor [Gemmataceae bacterium]